MGSKRNARTPLRGARAYRKEIPLSGGGALDRRLLAAGHVDGLQTLRPLLDLKLDNLVLEEAATPLTRDLRVVDEDVGAVVLLDEAPPLLVVEPFHPTHCHRNASTSTVATSTRNNRLRRATPITVRRGATPGDERPTDYEGALMPWR